MKTNIITTILLLAFYLSSCVSTENAPYSKNIDIYKYGSYIIIKCKDSYYNIRGELIAIDSNNIFVLNKYDKKCEMLSINDLKSFTLQYAVSELYGRYLPANNFIAISHGGVAAITLPVNIISLGFITGGDHIFKYNQKTISLNDLKMFARFPQGIPPNINKDSIK